MSEKLPTPAWCRKCNAGPYTWRNGLGHHVRQVHPELSPRERRQLLEDSIAPPGRAP